MGATGLLRRTKINTLVGTNSRTSVAIKPAVAALRAEDAVASFTEVARCAVARRILADERTNGFRIHGTWTSASLDENSYLTAEAVDRYRALFGKLELLKNDPEEGLEAGAVDTGRRVLTMMLLAKWSPPQLSWHGGDAVVFFWTVGDAAHAVTVVDGELGYLEQRGNIIVRSRDSVPIDGSCFAEFV